MAIWGERAGFYIARGRRCEPCSFGFWRAVSFYRSRRGLTGIRLRMKHAPRACAGLESETIREKCKIARVPPQHVDLN